MKHNLCVIGYGGMGGWHVRHALESDVINLKGVWDINPERLEVAKENGIYAYSSLEEVLNDKEVDLVTIATPNDVHIDLAIKALDAGKNVISEKPVTLNVKELETIIEAAKRNNKLFTVHQNRRWDTDFLAVKDLRDKNELGHIFEIESRVHGSRGIPGDWRKEVEHGGGMLYDWGIHLIDQILQIIPEKLISVNCVFDNITNTEVDDGFKLRMVFENEMSAYVEVGTYNFINMPRFYVKAEKGTGMINDWQNDMDVVKVLQWHEDGVIPVKTAAGLTKTMAPRTEKTTESYVKIKPKSDVHDFYRNYCRAIEGKEKQLVNHEEMIRVMKVIEVCFESARTNQTIKTNL
ncbi:MAG: Gfo/Idh/MocA family oxidoreductase [Clostridia bacterium]|nr:Gfo/Idh/MocA family oxidoreductase [Clostridia bacterium]